MLLPWRRLPAFCDGDNVPRFCSLAARYLNKAAASACCTPLAKDIDRWLLDGAPQGRKDALFHGRSPFVRKKETKKMEILNREMSPENNAA